MKRFFVEPSQIAEDQIQIRGSDVNHIRNVLRMKVGDTLWISDQEGKEYNCYIEQMEEEIIFLRIAYVQEPQFELPSRIILFQALPKGDKMEWIIQKAVELGVWEIVPMSTSRCVVKLDEKKAEKKVQRWQQIAESAAKQSKRMKIPEIHSVCTYKEALNYAQKCEAKLIPYEMAKDMRKTGKLLREIQAGQSVAIFIGPEGGFAQEEVQEAMKSGFSPITLGKRILRTETAGMVLLSVLMFQLEEGISRDSQGTEEE